MTYAAITGWGACMPPSVLTNADLSTFLETDDEWIVSRTGMKERRISHVSGVELARVASLRALACAGLAPEEVELIVFGSCTFDEQVPNAASGLQAALGARKAGALDLNTACTSFLYGLSTASALVKTGSVSNALVVGVEVVTKFMDWENRNVAVLFGDGCGAVVLQATDREEGLLADKLGCIAEMRHTLRIRGVGGMYGNRGVTLGDTLIDFEGQEIFRNAVQGMSQACAAVMAKCGVTPEDIDLVVPHQANLRIIEAVAARAGVPMEKVVLTVQKYANMSSATVPVALVEALETGRLKPGALVLMTAFGGGLTVCAQLVRWGDRVEPLGRSEAELAPCPKSALEMVNEVRAIKSKTRASSLPGLEIA